MIENGKPVHLGRLLKAAESMARRLRLSGGDVRANR
jgi:hypothetical protein